MRNIHRKTHGQVVKSLVTLKINHFLGMLNDNTETDV